MSEDDEIEMRAGVRIKSVSWVLKTDVSKPNNSTQWQHFKYAERSVLQVLKTNVLRPNDPI